MDFSFVLLPTSLKDQVATSPSHGDSDLHCNDVCLGLGTSSILGGVIMAALWRTVGQKHSTDSLIHAVGYFHYPGCKGC